MTTEDLNALRRAAADRLRAKLDEAIKAGPAALENLTLDQLVEAVIQACECGDFMRHVVCEPGPRPDGVAPTEYVSLTNPQSITYIPFRREQELQARIKALEEAAGQLARAVRDVEVSRYGITGPLRSACRELERVVEEEPE